MIGYPMWDYFSKGKGVLLGAYTFGRPAYIAAAKSPGGPHQGCAGPRRPRFIRSICPSMRTAWPWRGIACPGPLAAPGTWTDQRREMHYNNLCALDGRIMLANEHASRLPAWQEGSVLSALDAIGRLHARVMKP